MIAARGVPFHKRRKKKQSVHIRKEGFLTKQGGARGGRKNWKRRYFVLSDSCLYYYKEHEQNTLLGTISLSKSQLYDFSAEVKEPPAFKDNKVCVDCKQQFTMTNRVHHCRHCAEPHCGHCSSRSIPIPKFGWNNRVRVCNICYDIVIKELDSLSIDHRDHNEGFVIDSKKFLLPDGTKKNNLFSLKTEQRELWVHASTPEERIEWVKALQESIASASANPDNKDHEKWDIDFSEIELADLVGSGAFGDVFKASLWGTDVAAKKIRTEAFDSDEKIVEELKKEVDILNQLRHPNVILYMGVCAKIPNVCIITEWCSKGSLYDILHDNATPINCKRMIDIAMGVAMGMNYLHCLEKKIIHRDLKSHNVLLNESWQVKVADFGLSYIRKKKKITGHRRTTRKPTRKPTRKTTKISPEGAHYGVFGTPEWMAPEVMEGHKYNEKVDIYSYGIVLTEIVSRQMPFHDKYSVKNYMDVWDAVLDDGAIPTLPKWCDKFFTELVINCLSRDLTKRPSFNQIIIYLRRFENTSAEEFLIGYDLPRIREMLESPKIAMHALAVDEIAVLLKDGKITRKEKPAEVQVDEWALPPQRGRTGKEVKALYLEDEKKFEPYHLEDDEAAEIIEHCVGFLTSSSSQVQLSVCKALGNFLEFSHPTKRMIDREKIFTEGGVSSLINLVSSKLPEIVTEAKRVLVLVTKDLPASSMLVFRGISPEGLKQIASIASEDLLITKQKFEAMKKTMQEQEEFISTILTYTEQKVEKKIDETTTSNTNLIHVKKKPVKAKRGRPKANKRFEVKLPRETSKERELREAQESREKLDHDWISLLTSTEMKMPESFVKFYQNCKFDGYLLNYYKENEEWKLVYCILVDEEILVFQGMDDDPEDPTKAIPLRDIYGNGADVQIGIMFNQPFSFNITHGETDEQSCFSAGSQQLAIDWMEWILPQEDDLENDAITEISVKKSPSNLRKSNSMIPIRSESTSNYCRRCKASPAHPGISCLMYRNKKKHQLKIGNIDDIKKIRMRNSVTRDAVWDQRTKSQIDPNKWIKIFGACDHYGYLMKKKKNWNRWREMFFVLVDSAIHNYPTHRSKHEDLHNTLYICNKAGQQFGKGLHKSNKRKNCICIGDPNRTWYLAAPNEKILNGWIQAINKNIYTLQNQDGNASPHSKKKSVKTDPIIKKYQAHKRERAISKAKEKKSHDMENTSNT